MPKQTFFNLSDDKQSRLIEIALEEFAANDYKNASVRRIIEKTGIAPGSFYQYFASKQDLYSYLFELMVEKKRAFFSDAALPESQTSNIFLYLKQLAQTSTRFELAQPQFSQMAYRALATNSFPDQIVADGQKKGELFLQDLVSQSRLRGEINSDFDEDLVIFLINTILVALPKFMSAQMQLKPETERLLFDVTETDNIFDQTMKFLEHGLYGSAGKNNA